VSFPELVHRVQRKQEVGLLRQLLLYNLWDRFIDAHGAVCAVQAKEFTEEVLILLRLEHSFTDEPTSQFPDIYEP